MSIRHDLVRIATALQAAGLAIFPRSEDAPCQLNVDGVEGFYRLSPVGFIPEGQPNQVWLKVEQIENVCRSFGELVDVVDRYATEHEAGTLWAFLARAAGANVHFTDAQDPDCLCRGCDCQRRRLGAKAELASGARPTIRTLDVGSYGVRSW